MRLGDATQQPAAAAWGPSRHRGSLYLWLAEWAPHRGGATGHEAGSSELQQQSPGGPMPRGPATGGGGGLATPVGHVGDRPPRRGSFRGRLVSLRREAHPK